MLKNSLIGCAIVVALAATWIAMHLIPLSGALKTLKPQLVEQCTPLHIHHGTEDVAIDHRTGLVFVSATDRRRSPRNNPDDGIYAFDITQPSSVRRVSPDDLMDFHPHGISLWHGDGETRLFAISHGAQEGHSVEIFVVENDGTLAHKDSISFEAMYLPNDVVAVGPRAFYASNSRGYKGGLMGMVEQLFVLPLSSVVYFDGTRGDIVKSGLVYANGINRSVDGQTIYIAEVLKRRIGVYDRNVENGSLSFQNSIDLTTAPDNIDVGVDGSLLVAGHSRILDYTAHVGDPAAIAPSHVVEIDPATNTLKDVFVSTAGEINAASAAARSLDTLVVGAVLDGHVILCPLP